MEVLRVETHQINKSHELFGFCDKKCFESKNLYNRVNYILRQRFIKKDKKDEPSNKFSISYSKLCKEFKKTKEYKKIGGNIGQAILKLLSQDWKSFFKAIKDWNKNPHKYKGKPNLPGYAPSGDKGRKVMIQKSVNLRKDGKFKFPKEKVYFEPQNNDKNIKQVRIVPSHNRADRITHYNLEIVYEIEVPEPSEDANRVVGIDLGLDRLATCANNIGVKPFAINGKPVNSMNAYFNKKRAKFMEYVGDRGTSNRIRKLTKKRNNKIKHFFHCASRYIADWCNKHNIDTVVIGKNKGWKNESNMGKVTNQNWVSIPHNMIIKQIEYKCEEYGIKVIRNEESYTSKASFLDRDDIPTYKKGNDEKYEFSGRRTKRGLYKASDGTKIHADLNAGYNIIRKKLGDVFDDCKIHRHPRVINVGNS